MGSLYGRRIRLTIRLAPEKNASDTNKVESLIFEQKGLDPEGLRITFDINYPGISGWYYSEIVLYNLMEKTEKIVIDRGAVAILEAGYMGNNEDSNENFGRIFEGFVFQTLFERENVVNYKLTIRCIDGDRMFTEKNFVSTSLKKGMDLTTQINQVLGRSRRAIPIIENYASPDCPTLYRTEVVHKSPADFFNEKYGYRGSLKDANYRIYSYNSVVHIVDDSDMSTTPDYENMITVSPDNGGLIGTPKQTEYGCDFIVLLNPNIVLKWPFCVVKLDNVSFSQMRAEYMNNPIPNFEVLPDYKVMIFQVIGVKHVGDSRGNQWYTYVTGMNLAGARPTMVTLPEF